MDILIQLICAICIYIYICVCVDTYTYDYIRRDRFAEIQKIQRITEIWNTEIACNGVSTWKFQSEWALDTCAVCTSFFSMYSGKLFMISPTFTGQASSERRDGSLVKHGKTWQNYLKMTRTWHLILRRCPWPQRWFPRSHHWTWQSSSPYWPVQRKLRFLSRKKWRFMRQTNNGTIHCGGKMAWKVL